MNPSEIAFVSFGVAALALLWVTHQLDERRWRREAEEEEQGQRRTGTPAE